MRWWLPGEELLCRYLHDSPRTGAIRGVHQHAHDVHIREIACIRDTGQDAAAPELYADAVRGCNPLQVFNHCPVRHWIQVALYCHQPPKTVLPVVKHLQMSKFICYHTFHTATLLQSTMPALTVVLTLKGAEVPENRGQAIGNGQLHPTDGWHVTTDWACKLRRE
jgi:hypothetical protein